MPIAVQCSGCGGKFRATDEAAGKRVKCPKCSRDIVVPERTAEHDRPLQDGQTVAVRTHEIRNAEDVTAKNTHDKALPPPNRTLRAFRDDRVFKFRLVRHVFAEAILCLLGVPIGFGITFWDLGFPGGLSLLGFVLAIAGMIGFVYLLGKALYFLARPFDAKSLFEYILPAMFLAKNKKRMTFAPLIVPCDRSEYEGFCESYDKKCEAEIQRQGGGFVTSKSWNISISSDGLSAVCAVQLETWRTCVPEGKTVQEIVRTPLGKIRLHAKKSESGNWFVCLPDIERWQFTDL